MAGLTVSVAFLFFFFAFLSPAVARIQISKPKYDVIVRQLTNPLPKSDVKASLRLPSHLNKLKIHPLETRPELKLDAFDQKIRPIQKLQDSNAPTPQPVNLRAESVEKKTKKPIKKLQDSNAQKPQPVKRRAETVEKKTKKPVVPLPFLALPDLVAVTNHSELPIQKEKNNNEENKIYEQIQSDLDLIMKAQPEEEEKSKPIENQPESEEAQPETKAALPLKEVNFRLRSRLPYRLCRHSHLHHIDESLSVPSRSSQAEIPFGNDMIYTFGGENGDFDPAVFPGSFNHGRPKMFPFLHQHHVDVEEVSKHLPKTDEKVSYFLLDNDNDKVEIDRSSGAVRHRALPHTIPFLHRNGPRNLRRQDAIQKVSNHRLPENNNHGKDSDSDSNSNRLTKENNRGSGSHIPRKWIQFLHQRDLNKEKKPEKKESNLRKRIRKFLGQYFD